MTRTRTSNRAEQAGRRPIIRGTARRAGFTLIELSVVIVIILILASLATVATGRAIRSSRVAAERLLLVNLTQGVEQFKQQFNFYPPLVNDTAFGPAGPGPGPLPPVGVRQPAVRDAAFLRSETLPDEPRYSEYSLTYYLMGVLDAEDMAAASSPIDGVAGPGFTKPNPDGTFTRKGQAYAPFIDAGVRKRLVTRHPASNPADGKIVFTDRWYVGPEGPAIRYYRWLPGKDGNGADQYFVPRTVGDPNANQDLKNAAFAVVSLGADGLTDGRRPLPRTGTMPAPQVDATPIDRSTTADDIVETGQ